VINTLHTSAIGVLGGDVTLDGLTVSASGPSGVAVGVSSGTLTILSGDYYGVFVAIAGSADIVSGHFTTTSPGSCFTGTITVPASSTAYPAQASWGTVNEVWIVAKDQIYIK